jgi:hypothetical protein
MKSALRNRTPFLPSLLNHSTVVSLDSLNSNSSRERVRVTLLLAIYRQSVLLGDKPFETGDQYFFQLNTCSYSPYVISSDERMGLSLTIAAGPRQRSQSRILVPYFTLTDSSLSQPGGLGSRIYIPQEQGVPAISPGTGFPSLRLLRLAGLWWRYSKPRPGEPTENTVQSRN